MYYLVEIEMHILISKFIYCKYILLGHRANQVLGYDYVQ